MSDATNWERADRVDLSVLQYGIDHEGDRPDLEDTIVDMIADMYHLAHQAGFDVRVIQNVAAGHFDYELAEESTWGVGLTDDEVRWVEELINRMEKPARDR